MVRYHIVSMVFHWLIALLILVNLPLGYVVHYTELAIEDTLMNGHKVTGIIVLGLSVLRLFWRISVTVPSLPEATSVLQSVAVKAMHAMLYFLMLGLPFSGWWITSAVPMRHSIDLFILEIPYLPVAVGMEYAKGAHGIHSALAITLSILLVGHIAAALYHKLKLKDDVFDRMWPFQSKNR